MTDKVQGIFVGLVHRKGMMSLKIAQKLNQKLIINGQSIVFKFFFLGM